MKPGATSTPSMVPRLKGRQPITHQAEMASPVQPGNDNNKITKTSMKDNDDSDSENEANSNDLEAERSSEEDASDNTDSLEHEIENNSNAVAFECAPYTTRSALKMKEKSEYKRRSISQTKMQNEKYQHIDSYTQRKEKIIYHPIQRETVKPEGIRNNQYIIYTVIVLILALLPILVISQFNSQSELPKPKITIEKLKESFPQNPKFWKSIESSVSEIENFQKPSVIILMYKSNIQNMIELVDNITQYASCILNNNCQVKPIIIEGSHLNTYDIIQDHGIIIKRYRHSLEEKRIMVVKNIDEILGPVAQAFHYFCDEYSPLVKKSLILFTMQVNKYEGREIEQAVTILENKWSDINPDILEALITRVSSIVLRAK